MDPNMLIALEFGRGLGPAPELPDSIAEPRRRAEFVNAIDRLFAGAVFDPSDLERYFGGLGKAIGQSVAAFATISEAYLPTLDDPLDRVNVACRLWAGCLLAAKVIATETGSGPNTAEMRPEVWAAGVAGRGGDDPIFWAGVEAAVWLKELRHDRYSLDGLPSDAVASLELPTSR